MIGQLRGILLSKEPPHLLLDAHGVGYEIEAPLSTFYDLPAPGTEITLYTHLVVREDAHLLFGFASAQERTLFRTLLKVNGVGARLALAILSGVSAQGFVRCVQNNDSASLTQLPGIGKKTAERLILEMRDKLSGWEENAVRGAPVNVSPGDAMHDALSALVSLGYKPHEASRMLQGIDSAGLSREELIRRALQALAKA
ncbi:MAG: Holliday junction branch migration protein RuvA [Gammaproteobacteria bacterium]|nr:Holliday junction branch migration protein RuvA [Gammaproteobacteria bacterium]